MTRIAGKWCCSCRRWLPVEAFRPNSVYRDGVDSWCRPCHAQAVATWRANNPEYVAAYNAARRIGPRELECIGCGVMFVAGSRGPASSRCRDCRHQRKIEQRRALRMVRSYLSGRATRDG